MMKKRQFRVELKNGFQPLKFFNTPMEAKKVYGSEIVKYIEIITPDDDVSIKKGKNNLMLCVISRTDEEIMLSDKVEYTVTPHRPNKKKVYEGMVYLEIGETLFLESKLITFEKYDEILHHQWKTMTPPDGKTWKYVLRHEKSKILTLEEGFKKYGEIKKTQNGLIYIEKN